MRKRLLFLCAAVTIGQQSLSGSPQDRQEPPPTFRSGVELVQVDVFVTDEDGNPVRGLTADDFEILERGQPQTITTFAAVDVPRARGLPVEGAVDADVQTNDAEDSRVYLFALGSADAAHALRARAFLRRFLDEHFREDDMGSVVVGQGLATDGQDFTRNRRLLLTAVDKYSGSGIAVRDLVEHVEFLARLPGQRKALLWITESVPFDAYAVVDYQGGVLSLGEEYAHAVISAATRANIRIYAISPAALDPDARGAGHVEQRANFSALGAVTGGFSLIDSNNFAGAFERVIQETSVYYILGYESSAEPRPGRYTRFDVRVKRAGLRLKARPGYVEQLEYLKRRVKPEPAQPAVAVALGNPVSVPGLPMRVVATPYRKSGNTSAVSLTLDLAASGLDFARSGDQHAATLEIRHLATDVRNLLHPVFRHVTTLTVPDAQREQLRATGLRVVSQFELPSGRYQLRVASVSGAQSGSVVYDLEVPDFSRNALQMSGVSLSDAHSPAIPTLYADASGRASKGKDCRPPRCTADVRPPSTMLRWPVATADTTIWQDVLASTPTTRRAFERDETLTAFFEVYDNNTRVASQPEYSIDATLTLRTGEDSVVRTFSQARSSRAERRTSGGHGFVFSIPLSEVEPGSYVLDVNVRSARDSAQTVSRRIPISVMELSGRLP